MRSAEIKRRETSESVPEVFGSNVFSLSVMRERLPKNAFKKLAKTIRDGEALDPSIADVVANAMKDWAVKKGATHYSHWFQPMTGVTAEKHDSFISPDSQGNIIMEFSGKELIQGEPDASSFPSGGLRVTFEARGYTAWDCTSPVFVKEDGDNITMFIPCAFCSYTTEALDKKTPLLRSMDALNKQALRVLRALGNMTSKRIIATLGAEQEYFLLDSKHFQGRLDLRLTGRTLFGAPSPKGQEMDDHYFGSINERVASFMHEINNELWKLGVSAKTQHNEVSPAQYELAPVFATINVATDHNQLTMETMQKIAKRHNLECLLHEKPFAGVNGSGKHNNWSMSTDDGLNLLEPGDTPHQNQVFLIMVAAIIKAVDTYASLLRASVATSGNDHRLGGNEAPPAIVSIFLGEQLAEILEHFETRQAKGSKTNSKLHIDLGVTTLPPLPKDVTDRNRTSPFAFTGNKFEFRMPGSALSTAGPNFVLNTIIAESLARFADEMEKAKNVNAAAKKILQRVVKNHNRVVFNGDNYSQEWRDEAAKRGLPNLTNAVDALLTATEKDAVQVLKKHKVLSKHELMARIEVLLEQYSQTINIEALTTLDMVKRQILPAAIDFSTMVATSVVTVNEASGNSDAQTAVLNEVCELTGDLNKGIKALERAVAKASTVDNVKKQAMAYRDEVIPAMTDVRAAVDGLEVVVDAKVWPLATYADMLFWY
ncbi:glutamine synthetase III [Candidatus Hydrogenedentota bacterium]